jgi:hypothetical protein
MDGCGEGGLQPIRNNCIKTRDEELGWTDDGTDDATDGWKGGPTPTNTAGQTDTTDIIMLEMDVKWSIPWLTMMVSSVDFSIAYLLVKSHTQFTLTPMLTL